MENVAQNLILCIDTSMRCLGLAVIDLPSKKILSQKISEKIIKAPHASHQIDAIFIELMRKLSFTLEDFSEIWVSVGPGSFTGIRIGLAFCYGLMCVQSFQSLPYSSLLQTAEKLQKQLFLKSTKRFGYATIFKDGAFKLEVVDLTKCTLGKGMLENPEICIVNEWQEFEDTMQGKAKVSHIEDALVTKLAWEYMIEHMSDAQTRTKHISTDFPQPLYMRPSSVEENI